MITKLHVGMLFWLILTTIGMSIMCHIKLIAGISMEDKMGVSYSHVLMDLATEFQFSSSVISTRITVLYVVNSLETNVSSDPEYEIMKTEEPVSHNI